MKTYFKAIVFVIVLIVLVSILPCTSFAGNNNSLPPYGYSGKGDDKWKYPKGGTIYNSMGVGVITPEIKADFDIIYNSEIVTDQTVDVNLAEPEKQQIFLSHKLLNSTYDEEDISKMLITGDVLAYYTDRRASEDFKGAGTH